MNKILFVSSLFIIFFSSLYSQPKIGSITGSVLDKSNGKPIENADITLIREKDSSVVSGTSTDKNGNFTFNELPPGRFILRANIVGYNFAYVSGILINRDKKDITLDPIKLSLSTATTDEILVEDEKALIEFMPDKKVFNVSKNLTTQGSTLLDLLREVPSVNIDQDGNVSLRGSEGVKITIDGRKSGLEGQNRNIILEQIPASSVESIELITNPSAKYEAEGTVGIINIVLKKNKTQSLGYNGTAGLNIGTGDKYSGQLSLNLKNKKMNLFGNYSYDIRNFLTYGFNNRSYFNSFSISSTTQLDSGKRRGKSHILKFGLDYNPDKYNLFGLILNYRKSDRTSSETGFYQDFDNSGNLISDYRNFSSETDNGYNYDINANFLHNFTNPKQFLSAEISYSRDKDDEAELNSEIYSIPVNNTPNKRNEYSIETDDDFYGKADYVHPVSKDIKIEAGLKLSYTKRDIDFRVENFDYSLNQYITDYNETNRFIYKEQINAVYGIYTQQAGSFGFSLGSRVEHTIIKGDLANGSGDFDRSYIDIFPSASISQKLGISSELQLSYSRRVHRPRHRELNPFRSYWGSNSYRQGNPNLDPEFTDSYEFSFIKYFPWATITPGIFYRYTKNEISPQRTLIDSVTTLTMPVNLNNSKSYGGELIVNLQPYKFFSINGTFSYYKTEVDANNIESGLTNSSNSWSARAMSSLILPQDIMFQLTYFYRGKRVTAQGTMEPFQMLNAAVKKDFFDKRLSVSLRLNDILDNAKFKVQFNDQYYNEVFERRRDSRTLTLNITYNFGQKDSDRQNKRKKKNNENNDNGDDDMEF